MALSFPSQRLSTKQLNEDTRLLLVYGYYRATLASMLVLLFFLEGGPDLLGVERTFIYKAAVLGYFAASLVLLAISRATPLLHKHKIILNILIDIAALSILSYASGGASSGVDNLLIFSVAAGSILLGGKYALFFAASSSIAVMVLEVYRDLIHPEVNAHYFEAGAIGVVYFVAAIFISHISQRIRASESLTQSQASDIIHLEQLNRLIIQRMQTGILVCGQLGQVRMMNESAEHLLLDGGSFEDFRDSADLSRLSPPLFERLLDWQRYPLQRTQPFQGYPGGPKAQANFSALEQGNQTDILIFLEDSAKVLQQAQQLKLASLGQLTASIAHEIRNPLGAISHAAQLLSETPELQPGQERLANIIHDHSRRMNITIENILELSRRRAPAPEIIKLGPWLGDFVNHYNQSEHRPGKFNIEVVPDNLEVKADPTQLMQVITNLCHNGLRFSEQQSGEPTLFLRAGVLAHNDLPYLDIIDQGPGVSPEAAQRLFEPFYTTRKKGTGLGLYISRELCEANNARLEHIASYTSGGCFRIIFPHPKKIENL